MGDDATNEIVAAAAGRVFVYGWESLTVPLGHTMPYLVFRKLLRATLGQCPAGLFCQPTLLR